MFLRRHRQSHQSLIDTGAVIDRLIERTRQDELTWYLNEDLNRACTTDGGFVLIPPGMPPAKVLVFDSDMVPVAITFFWLQREKLLTAVYRQECRNRRAERTSVKDQARQSRVGALDLQVTHSSQHAKLLQDMASHSPKP